MQPGYDALGFISCTGTNFLVRSRALVEVGGSPTWTLTEDFALGMELKKSGWHCRYVQEYLAIGEAPDAVRNCYQQRSRWCKGHFQIFFSLEHCPSPFFNDITPPIFSQIPLPPQSTGPATLSPVMPCVCTKKNEKKQY